MLILTVNYLHSTGYKYFFDFFQNQLVYDPDIFSPDGSTSEEDKTKGELRDISHLLKYPFVFQNLFGPLSIYLQHGFN